MEHDPAVLAVTTDTQQRGTCLRHEPDHGDHRTTTPAAAEPVRRAVAERADDHHARSPHDVRTAHQVASYVRQVQYEIVVDGHLSARWSAWFDGFAIAGQADGTTVLRGLVVDQAALHGLLQRLRDLGIPLISLTPLDPEGN